MKILVRVFISVAALSALPNLTAAQTGASQADPCMADPAAPPRAGSLTNKLNDCNGVLVPPKIGDGEIVQPAPEGGEIRVIPPSALPEQNSDRATNADGGPGYDIAELVDAIAHSATTARSLPMLADPRVEVRDISILLSGSNAAVLNASLMEHAGAVESLREAISANTALASAVTGTGLSIQGIVAAQIDNEHSVTIFGH